MSNYKETIIVTGGAGFIGSHVIRLFANKYPDSRIVNLDSLTYAGNLENLSDIENLSNYTFIKASITDREKVFSIFDEFRPNGVIHLAAESHVDRSIKDPSAFIHTNISGTINLLDACREIWKNFDEKKFYHISTDEVYGSLTNGFFTEETAYDPKSPYSASKASSDHFVRAYHNTYGMPVVISNCSNNYGPNQFPEKLIPLMINNIRNNKPLPVYGEGTNIRDWLYVEDHAEAIDTIYRSGKNGESYAIGGENEWKNIDLIRLLCRILDSRIGRVEGTSEKLITYVKDRAGHDFRYAIDASKLKKDLGWSPSLNFESGLMKTVDWYLNNDEWMNHVTTGDYQQYYKEYYS